ncbi:hypothetical protein M409DRAFT_49742 [Zasmidium cellare ATCC 36951]|uniref:Zn(2)-C6 fungal-type domain-containing protein n=1 Tax=Zasmidium cellare ATCC 36951 TaxID=1080233 RepID=A0A6A6D6I2_ZASCE|nr:uncharacterized protein M409DRAFT_49742 [Zasmidium cellare ATCC 36951]KAF2173276.1 hypothetical protein M409DRAFT_49742 [Zasmidium cellare ATCC 36951]
MVNHGASRACAECKARHKRACRRCTEASRPCPGYIDDFTLFLRPYQAPSEQKPALTTPSWSSRQDFEVPDARRSEAQSDGPLEPFFNDFCLASVDRKVSRGFFDGLRDIVISAGQQSDLAQAAVIVGSAAVSNRSRNALLAESAQDRYVTLLESFGRTVACQSSVNTVETLMTCVLLGIYEVLSLNLCVMKEPALTRLQIVRDDGQSPTASTAHVKGVCSILSQENAPFNLEAGTRLFQLANPILMPEGRSVRLNMSLSTDIITDEG